MKKIFLVLLLSAFALGSYAQKGDLFVGAVGGYALSPYKSFLYGANVSYHLSDPWEASFTFLMNPEITTEDLGLNRNTAYYSANADIRLYMLRSRFLATGPALGIQYLYNKHEYSWGDDKETALGVNLGWHIRANITDNMKLNLGWRYSTGGNDMSYNLFYLGLGYSFFIP